MRSKQKIRSYMSGLPQVFHAMYTFITELQGVFLQGIREWYYDESESVMMGNDIDRTVQPQGF